MDTKEFLKLNKDAQIATIEKMALENDLNGLSKVWTIPNKLHWLSGDGDIREKLINSIWNASLTTTFLELNEAPEHRQKIMSLPIKEAMHKLAFLIGLTAETAFDEPEAKLSTHPPLEGMVGAVVLYAKLGGKTNLPEFSRQVFDFLKNENQLSRHKKHC